MAKSLKEYSKNWLIKKVESLQEALAKKDEELNSAYKQQFAFKEMAEKAGSDMAKYKHELIKLKEKNKVQ